MFQHRCRALSLGAAVCRDCRAAEEFDVRATASAFGWALESGWLAAVLKKSLCRLYSSDFSWLHLFSD